MQNLFLKATAAEDLRNRLTGNAFGEERHGQERPRPGLHRQRQRDLLLGQHGRGDDDPGGRQLPGCPLDGANTESLEHFNALADWAVANYASWITALHAARPDAVQPIDGE